jgi:hypothetical protein
MFGKWLARERRRNIRTRYLTPVRLTPTSKPSTEPLPAFLMELWDGGAVVVLGEELAANATYVLRISGEQGISDEPLCAVTQCRRADASRFVARLTFTEAKPSIRPVAA